MIDLSFKQIAPGVYQKWNALMGIRTTIKVAGDKIHVRHEQPKQLIADILELNVARQNSFSGYKGKEMVQATAVPYAIDMQIKKKCGWKPGNGDGYDVKKFKSIVNDIDNYKLKTVPGKI